MISNRLLKVPVGAEKENSNPIKIFAKIHVET
jgi:hypothetical protein